MAPPTWYILRELATIKSLQELKNKAAAKVFGEDIRPLLPTITSEPVSVPTGRHFVSKVQLPRTLLQQTHENFKLKFCQSAHKGIAETIVIHSAEEDTSPNTWRYSLLEESYFSSKPEGNTSLWSKL